MGAVKKSARSIGSSSGSPASTLGRVPAPAPSLLARSSVEDVSFEHAPPRGLGGRTIALTCRECNSTSGFNLDAELHKAERIRKWDRGQLAEPLRAPASIAGLPPLNVDLHRDPDLTTRSLGVPARNDPAITAAHVAWSQAGLESGEPSRDPVHVALPWFRERRARIALLRSAYTRVRSSRDHARPPNHRQPFLSAREEWNVACRWVEKPGRRSRRS